MLEKVYSLYATCLDEVSALIMENYWRDDTSCIPFFAFPPKIVQDLIESVCRKSSMSLESSNLLMLLTSGRVTNLKIDDVRITLNNAENIFSALLPWGERLKSIEIKGVYCLGGPWKSKNLGVLLQSAKALVSLDTCINFSITELSNCVNLQKLSLDFEIKQRLSSFLEVDGEMRSNHSLKVLKIYKYQVDTRLHVGIAEILQWCVELVEVEYDVMPSLVYLHENNKTTRYKLRKALLGAHSGPFAVPATVEKVLIAASSCPDLREVEVSPMKHAAIHALSNFHRISVLTLNEPRWANDNYHSAIHPLLDASPFGHNLRSLYLRYFSRVNFAAIGACCPNLEELKVEFISEENWPEFPSNSYQKLISLHLENLNDEPCLEFSLAGILSNATVLEFLTIRNASTFTDSILDKILKNNAVFSKLKSLIIEDCGFSINALQKLAKRMSSIKHVSISSRIISVDEAKRVLNNVDIIFRWIHRT